MKKIIVIAVVVGCMASVAAPQGVSAEEASSRGVVERLLSAFGIDKGGMLGPPVSESSDKVIAGDEGPWCCSPPESREDAQLSSRQRMPPEEQ